MNTVKTALIEHWEKTAKMFLRIQFDPTTQKWTTMNTHEAHILTQLKLAAKFKTDKPDPPDAYDLLLREAGKKGLGLETISEEE